MSRLSFQSLSGLAALALAFTAGCTGSGGGSATACNNTSECPNGQT